MCTMLPRSRGMSALAALTTRLRSLADTDYVYVLVDGVHFRGALPGAPRGGSALHAGDGWRPRGRHERARSRGRRLWRRHEELGHRAAGPETPQHALPSSSSATASSASGPPSGTRDPRRASSAARCTDERTCSTSSRSGWGPRPNTRSTRSWGRRRARRPKPASTRSPPSTTRSIRTPSRRCVANRRSC
jgi:hypothetical protein